MTHPEIPVNTPGWECPRCGRVYAPTVLECLACNHPVKGTQRLEASPQIVRKIAEHDDKILDEAMRAALTARIQDLYLIMKQSEDLKEFLWKECACDFFFHGGLYRLLSIDGDDKGKMLYRGDSLTEMISIAINRRVSA